MNITAIVFGASGMVGEGVLHEALHHPDVGSVLVVGRTPCGVQHPKLKELIHKDFYEYGSIRPQLQGYNACFFCLGTTSIGKSEKDYTRITYDLTMQAARTLSELNPAMTFCYVSGLGTDSTEQGRTMWARVKGKTENDLTKLPFKSVYQFRPGFIRPTKGLKHAFFFAQALGLVYPVLHGLFPSYVCTLSDIGLAMIRVVANGYHREILECKEITAFAQTQHAH
jgi:uncharacterized protein YbjT (DUF2867 family)